MFNRYNRTKGIGTLQNPKAEIFGNILGNLGSTALNAIGNSAGNIVSDVLKNKNDKDIAKINAGAAAQDQRQTGVTNEFFQQLQQSLSQLDKSVVEKLFGTSDTNEITKQLQTMQQNQQTAGQSATDQTQTTIRGDAGANSAILQNIMQLSQQFGGDGDAVMDAAIGKTLRSGAGAIAGVGNRSGTFGDTTTALLQNDLVTRAAEAGVLAQSQRQGQMSQSLAQLMGSLQAGQEVTTGKQATTNTENVATTGQTQSTGQNTSSTQTTQDRTAQEKATETGATSTTGQSNQTSDVYTDFAKDGSTGMGSKNGTNPIASLGQNIGNAPVGSTQIGTAAPGTPVQPANPLANLQLPGLTLPTVPGQAVNTKPVMSGQPVPAANPVAQIAGQATIDPQTLAALGLTPEQLQAMQGMQSVGTQPTDSTGVWLPPKRAVM